MLNLDRLMDQMPDLNTIDLNTIGLLILVIVDVALIVKNLIEIAYWRTKTKQSNFQISNYYINPRHSPTRYYGEKN